MIIYNSDGVEKVKANLLRISNIVIDKERIICPVRIVDPLNTVDSIKEKIIQVNSNEKLNEVLIDITTFTHETLLILIKVFSNYLPSVKLTFIYANAKEYNKNNKFGEKWLSKGISEVRSVIGYSGDISPIKKNALIVIVGYETDRAKSVIDFIEPSILGLGYGKSSNSTTLKNRSANEKYISLLENIANSNEKIFRFEVKCNDPNGTASMIETQIKKFEGYNIIIVPMNNKITTIGVAKAAIRNPKIQLCYAPAEFYNVDDYSVPGGYCYIETDFFEK